jgi:hypothetical protein
MGFIPEDVDTKPIVIALESALPDVLSSPVGELNFRNVIQKLGDVMYKFPFSLPPFYIAIIRCLGVLEGLAIQVDKDFRIINDAYPYIAARLLTDQSSELQEALRQLLFKDNEPRWERLQELLEKAGDTNDYDSSLAVDQLITYLASPQGTPVTEILIKQSIDIIDEISAEVVDYIILTTPLLSFQSMGTSFFERLQKVGNVTDIALLLSVIAQVITDEANTRLNPSTKLINAGIVIKSLQATGDFNLKTLTALTRKLSKEPVMVNIISRITSALLEKASSRFFERLIPPSS